jgi:eukaryotic-like serine/threonine-protein kinase
VSRFEIAAVDLKSGKHRVLTRGVYARYVAPGYLVVLRADGALVAAPFDQDRLELTGPSVTIGGGTELGSRFQDMAVTDDGTLVHVDQDVVQDSSEIVWVDRAGRTTPVDPTWRANFESVALSPDGRQLATGVLTREGAEVWIAQLPTGTRAKLSAEGEINYRPSWVHDGRVAFRSASTGRFELVAKRADGLGLTERMATDSRSISSGFVSRDGQWRIYRTDATEDGRGDILALRAGDSVPTPLVATDAEERYPALSPNGRWLAYRTDEGGRTDVWVRPFPNVSDGRWQVSVAGGTEPTWSRSGRELFYLTPANELVAARVTTDPPFTVHDRRVLFTRPSTMALNIATVTYDVSLDDSHFLMIRSVGRSRPGYVVADNAGGRLVLVEHWVEELKARVPR